MMGRPHERGSVLVDALVAVAVMTLVLAAGAQALGRGARRTAAVAATGLEVLEARSRLAEVGADIPLQPGQSAGVDGDLAWSVDIAPYGADPRLLEVTVRAEDARGGPRGAGAVSLSSLRLGSGE